MIIQTDPYLFYIVEVGLFFFVLYAFLKDKRISANECRAGILTNIIRGKSSMSVFYAAYGVFSGVLVAIALSNEAAAGNRTFFTLFNLSVSVYLCLYNAWFKNLSLRFVSAIRETESTIK